MSGHPALSAQHRAAFEENSPSEESVCTLSGGVETVTLGCRLNMVESEELARQAKALGETDLAIVNTCAVTAEALRRSRQAVRRLGRERPSARLIVTGCAATLHAKDFAAMPGVARVISNDDKNLEPSAPGTPRAIGAAEGTRGFLAVQNGCDHRCTFCVIPFGRGDSRSAPPDEVLGEARALVASGKREIVLTGVDLTAYGADIGEGWTLPRLARMLLAALPDIERLRFSSIDCIEAGSELIDAMAQEPRLAPHLHLSLQSGDDLILKRMKRRHSRRDAVDFCRRLRAARPETVLGADLIVGFPTETEEMFRRTLDLVEDCGLTHLHVFPFSPRPGRARGGHAAGGEGDDSLARRKASRDRRAAAAAPSRSPTREDPARARRTRRTRPRGGFHSRAHARRGAGDPVRRAHHRRRRRACC